MCTAGDFQNKILISTFKISSFFLRRECDEELQQVQLRMLREGYDDPERRIEVIDVNEEGGVLLDAEYEVVL